MTDPKHEKDERKLTAYERWELPHLNDNKASRDPLGVAILVQKDDVVVTEEIDQDALIYEPLTASQLEEIRSAAYDEGFIQGEEEGHVKGHSDGFAKGEVDGFEKGHEDGITIGLEEGRVQAKADAQTQLETLEALLTNIVKEMTQPLEESRVAAENILYQSMVRMIENVCLSKMHEDGGRVLKEQLSRVFDEIGEYEGRIKLRLHSCDISVLESLGVSERLRLQTEVDDSIISGGFIIDSKSFHIDGRVEQRLDAVFNELRHLSSSDQG